MNISRRQILKNSGCAIGALVVLPVISACSHAHHHPAPKKRRRVAKAHLRWARPRVLYVPRRSLYVGAVIVLPDGQSATVKKVHANTIDVSVAGNQSTYGYEVENIN